MQRRTFLALGAIARLSTADAAGQADPPAVRVVAASDLKFALAVIADNFTRQTGQAVQLTMGSSGSFAQQIRQGLPADIFLSADEDYVFQLADAGLTRDRGDLYAIGRIALFAGNGSPVQLESMLRGERAAADSVRHFAIADPGHAPYGRAARQTLERLGLWGLLQTRLVLGENISQTTQFLTTGAADAGITALSLALSPEVAARGRFVLIPETLHSPLRQRMVLLKSAAPGAMAFYNTLQAASTRAVLQRFGFTAP